MYWQCVGLSQAELWQDLTRLKRQVQNHSSTVVKASSLSFIKTVTKLSSKYIQNRSINRPGSDPQAWQHTAAFGGQAYLE